MTDMNNGVLISQEEYEELLGYKKVIEGLKSEGFDSVFFLKEYINAHRKELAEFARGGK